jgi:hypothetical protein
VVDVIVVVPKPVEVEIEVNGRVVRKVVRVLVVSGTVVVAVETEVPVEIV